MPIRYVHCPCLRIPLLHIRVQDFSSTVHTLALEPVSAQRRRLFFYQNCIPLSIFIIGLVFKSKQATFRTYFSIGLRIPQISSSALIFPGIRIWEVGRSKAVAKKVGNGKRLQKGDAGLSL